MRASVILSYYKQLEILKRSLFIWCNQTFPAEEYEILVMDGGRDEEAIDHVRWCKRNYPGLNIRYFIYDGRVGWKCPVHSWNVGIRQARGDVIIHTMEDRFTTFDAVEALYWPVEKPAMLRFCTVLPWHIQGQPEDNFIETVDWRSNPRLLWAVSEPSPIAKGRKMENETVLFSIQREYLIELGGHDERWRDYGYWMLDLYARMLGYGLKPYEVSWVINTHHPHHRHGTMNAHLFDGAARRDAWAKIRELNGHGYQANRGIEDWGAMDGDEEVEL
jgi:hypothetical protein